MKMNKSEMVEMLTEAGYEASMKMSKTKLKERLADSGLADEMDAIVENANEEMREMIKAEEVKESKVKAKKELKEQAWDRKYNKYFNDEQIGEDAVTLLNLGINKVMGKVNKVLPNMKYMGSISSWISPVESKLAYVIDGRYEKDNSWAYADIRMDAMFSYDGKFEHFLVVQVDMAIVSGQIKKFHMTATDLIAKIREEAELNEIDIESEEEA